MPVRVDVSVMESSPRCTSPKRLSEGRQDRIPRASPCFVQGSGSAHGATRFSSSSTFAAIFGDASVSK